MIGKFDLTLLLMLIALALFAIVTFNLKVYPFIFLLASIYFLRVGLRGFSDGRKLLGLMFVISFVCFVILGIMMYFTF